MPTKKNHSKKIFIIALIGCCISAFVFLQNQVDSKIANHPKIVRMEVRQENIEEKLDTVISQMDVLNDKLDELLRQ